jgi:chaperone BCS1
MNEDGFWERVISKAKRPLDTIYLPKADKQSIVDDITWFISPETQSRYKSLGRTHKRVYLFEGLPGTGKTSFIGALASWFEYDIAFITFTDKVSDGKLMRLIKSIPEKTFLILEDIDGIFEERKKGDTHKNQLSFSGILNALDGITTKDNFICFITTNHKNLLDPALLRYGRIDKQLTFTYATKEQINTIYEKFMGAQYTKEGFKLFYSAYKELSIETSMSLMQEYLFKYLDNPEMALGNIDELKGLHSSTVKDSDGKLYS